MKAESMKHVLSWIVEPTRNWSCNANYFLPSGVEAAVLTGCENSP